MIWHTEQRNFMTLSPKKHTNRLHKEKSPYLLQHAHNPVDWYPWGPEALEKAKQENKVIFLSIGYSTCHWCHVMERESFENEEIAALLNEHFISVKVDREERPDIDHIYMAAVQAMTRSGGWPMSVFLTPDLKPFVGGTYFPPEDRWGRVGMKNLIPRIADLWKTRPHEVIKSAEDLTQLLEPAQSSQSKLPEINALMEKTFYDYRSRYDSVYGGFGEAPKFPSSHNLSFLLFYGKHSKDPASLEMVKHTLIRMAQGGMYDQLGGGFHRYSTDQYWLAPHFEKMLYDQATLARTYIEAYQVTKDPFYQEIARDIFKYVLRDMTHPEGGFYSAEDADSEGEEGKFYVWNPAQIKEVLGEADAKRFNAFYDVTDRGNFEHQGMSILHIVQEESPSQFQTMREKLLSARNKRIHPLKDDKILTSWNGLMISALAYGGAAFNEKIYIEKAKNAAEFVLSKLQKEGRLIRRYRNGEASFLAYHEDYAYLILGLLDLYEATFEIKWLSEAKRLAKEMLALFEDPNGGFFYTAKDAEKMIAPTKDYYDGAIPSPNSISAWVLVRLARIFPEDSFEESARKIFLSIVSNMEAHPTAFPWMVMSLAFYESGAEIVYYSKESQSALLHEVQSSYYPAKILIGCRNPKDFSVLKNAIEWLPDFNSFSASETVLLCQKQTCELPASDLETLKKILD